MKALRTLLFLVLVIVVLAIGTLFFSGKIIESKLNSLISEDKRKELELKEIIKSLDS